MALSRIIWGGAVLLDWMVLQDWCDGINFSECGISRLMMWCRGLKELFTAFLTDTISGGLRYCSGAG